MQTQERLLLLLNLNQCLYLLVCYNRIYNENNTKRFTANMFAYCATASQHSVYNTLFTKPDPRVPDTLISNTCSCLCLPIYQAIGFHQDSYPCHIHCICLPIHQPFDFHQDSYPSHIICMLCRTLELSDRRSGV